MKAAAFEYARPGDLAGALKLLAQSGLEAKPISGGQSLGPMLNLRLARPQLLVDVGRLDQMRGIEDRGGFWHIGGAVTHAALEDAALPGCGVLSQVAQNIAYRTIRNRGTIGGSLAHADPAADWPLALAALDATVVIVGPQGERRVLAGQFIQGAFATVLSASELVVALEVPKLSAQARWGYWKFCRKTGEFAEASAAMLVDPERKMARLWVGALEGAPQPLERLGAEIALRGPLAATETAVNAALERVAPNLDPVSRRLHVTAVRRAVEKGFD
jgi:aerobic carbon-monoxide dehydrogenase medium subunit